MEALRWSCAQVWRPGAYAPGLSFDGKDTRTRGRYSIFKERTHSRRPMPPQSQACADLKEQSHSPRQPFLWERTHG